MLVSNRARSRRGRMRGLGTISTQVGNSLVYSSNPIGRSVAPVPVRGVPARPIYSSSSSSTPTKSTYPTWGANPPQAYGNGYGSQYGSQYGSSYSAPSPWSAGNSPYGSTPQNPNNSQALAAAQALLQTNPSLLTQQQFSMLQAAGLISNTLPYSSVSQITAADPTTSSVSTSTINDPNCVAAGCTGGPYPNCTCPAAATSSTDIGAMLDTTYAGLPLYLWLLIGGGGLYLFSGRKR